VTTVLLIRHGENDFMRQHRLAGWLPGIHLNARGRAQAEALLPMLESLALEAIYSSPLERAVETAAPLARARRLPLQRRPGMGEIRYGSWQGRSLSSLRRLKLWSRVQATPSLVTIPEGESFRQAQARMIEEIEHLRELHRGAVACFSHADPIKLALSFYLGQPLDLFQRLTIDPASVSTLVFAEDRVRVIGINDTRATRSGTRG
jgi:probable phosphoglycerate mutase